MQDRPGQRPPSAAGCRRAQRTLRSLAAPLLASAVLSPPLLGEEAALCVDDFEHTALNWRHKPNVTLSLLREGDGRVLQAEIDFSKARYAWFRKTYHAAPLDLRRYNGVELRIKGGGPGCRLLFHLMTDTSVQPPRTFALGAPRDLDFDAWTTVQLAWVEMGREGGGEPISSEDLGHVEEVNFSVTSTGGGGSATVWLDDVRIVRLPPGVLEAKVQGVRYRTPIQDEAEFSSLLDYDGIPGLTRVRAARPQKGSDYSAAKAALLEHLRTRCSPSYYFDPRQIAALAEGMTAIWPRYPGAVVRAADRLLTHEYTWEGETRKLTRPIDYCQNGRQWSAVLNRFSFLTSVARAWWFGRDEKYAEEVVGQLCEWAESCPVPRVGSVGRVWAALEVGCRAHTWLRLYLSVLHSTSMTPEANYRILKSLAEHARFLSDPNLRMGLPNMVIVESTGLAGLGIMLPELADARQWRERGIAVLDAELRRRVLSDGAWEEVTPGYHSWVAHSCLGFAILAQRNNIVLPPGFDERFRSMYEWLLRTLKPNGRTPMLGDASDSHLAHLMSEAALFFRDPELKYFAREQLPVSFIELFGAGAPKAYSAIEREEPHFGSMLLPDCKLAVMRTGYQKTDSYLLFDFGPIWSHTHEDTLGFELYAAGQTLLWDSGVCQYDLPECRTYYHQARAHNVVLVDDRNLRLNGTPILHKWETAGTHDWVDAEARFSDPDVTHRRQILFVKPRCWVIRDVLRSEAKHRYERLFHVREKAQVTVDGSMARAQEGNGPVLAIHALRPSTARIETAKGLLTYNHGRGPGCNNLPAPVVKLVSDAPAGVADLVTVLIVTDAGGHAPELTVMDSGGSVLRLETIDGVWEVRVPPLANGNPGPMSITDLK